MRKMIAVSSLLFAVLGVPLNAVTQSSAPSFRQYPSTESLHGPMVLPRIISADEREFHTTLRQAITKGYNVVDGGTEHEKRGPNFGGHYVLVQWGCGSNCMEAALIDANTGIVLHFPQISGAKKLEFVIPTGSADFRTLQFRTNSRLLGIPYIGDSNTYYYVLERNQWHFLKKLPTSRDMD